MSKLEAHRLYRVSRTTIDDWIGLRQQTGSLRPLPRRQSKGCVLWGAVFSEFAQRHAGQKLGQMAAAWEQEQGQKLSLMTFSVALRRRGNVAPKGWTRKKRVGATANAVKKKEPNLSKP